MKTLKTFIKEAKSVRGQMSRIDKATTFVGCRSDHEPVRVFDNWHKATGSGLPVIYGFDTRGEIVIKYHLKQKTGKYEEL